MSSNNVISEIYKKITETIDGFKLLPSINEKITAAADAAYDNAEELKTLKTNIQISTGASDLEIDSIIDSYHSLQWRSVPRPRGQRRVRQRFFKWENLYLRRMSWLEVQRFLLKLVCLIPIRRQIY